MDDRGVAPALSLFSAAFRLSLPKGEGRVRDSDLQSRRTRKPLTSVLSPSKKGERRSKLKTDQYLAAKLSVLDCKTSK